MKFDCANTNIRSKIHSAGLYQYQVANEINVGETTLIRWLRTPLTPEKEMAILAAIDNLSKQRA